MSNEEELAKVLMSYALSGAALIQFDNIVSSIGGGVLDLVITATDTVSLRVLGRSEQVTVPWRAVIALTGNNVTIASDTSQRVILQRLEPREERHGEVGGYKIQDLRAWAREHRPRLAIASLTLLQAYVAAGRPDVGGGHWGGFEEWARLVPAAIVWAGGADVLACRLGQGSDAADDDDDARTLGALIDGVELLNTKGDGLTVGIMVTSLYPPERLRRDAPMPPDDFEPMREAIETLVRVAPGHAPNPKSLARALKRYLRRVRGGRMLDRQPGQGGTQRWYVRSVRVGGVGGVAIPGSEDRPRKEGND